MGPAAFGERRPAITAELRWDIWLIVGLSALTVLRLLSLAASKTDLYFDEAQYWTWAQAPAFGYYSKPPAIAWAIWLTTHLCGNSEASVRLSAPLFHAGSAAFLFLAAKRLYDARTGFWTALIFATLPGISFSANIISTDVLLLFFWCAALYFGIRLEEDRNWGSAIACGIAIGLGLLAKYAVAYFYLCGGLWLLIEPRARWLLHDLRTAALLVIPLALLAPNLIWNLHNGLVTFTHTAANADLNGVPLHPLNMLSFLGSQFGVFGPILFPMLLWIAIRCVGATWQRRPCDPQDRMLLMFSMPMLVIVTVLAFLSRAHANWAAPAFPAGTILVTATMLRLQRRRLMAATLCVNLLAFAIFAIVPAFADRAHLPGRGDPFAPMLGWRATAEAVRGQFTPGQYGTLLTNDRGLTAELLYYLRDSDIPIRTWRSGPPQDHYQLTRPFLASDQEPVLLVTLRAPANSITDRFSNSRPVAIDHIATGAKSARTVMFRSLDGFRGMGDVP